MPSTLKPPPDLILAITHKQHTNNSTTEDRDLICCLALTAAQSKQVTQTLDVYTVYLT